MKLGRNALCLCGSGKKYKHCCMSNISKERDQLFGDVETMLAMSPDLTLDDLNAVLQHKVQARNHQPHEDFCGISPMQMENWLYAPFDELRGVVISTPSDMSSSPVIRYLTLIIDAAMQAQGSFKATSKGNLPAKLVKQATELLPEFAVAQFEINSSISEFAGSNEDKFNALHYTKVLAEISGILYRRSGRYHVKKSAQKQYQTLGIQAFFKPMLEAAISKYNWGYFDSFGYDIDLQRFWLFMLWRLQTHSHVSQLANEVATAFPDLLRAFPKNDYSSPESNLSMLIESRFINRFLTFWGFVIMNPKRFIDGKPVDRMVNVQPLLKQTFQFDINS